ncbi:hypothetical protein ABFS83_02G039700 [Erythranthe nasuta]
MAGIENQIPTRNRASRKRPNQSAGTNPVKKNRVVLGDLTNTSSNLLSRNPGQGKTRKIKPDPDPKKRENELNLELVVSPGPDEKPPQKSGYASSIFRHLHSLEVDAKRRPLSNYIERIQNDITPVMRSILVDWLVEVSQEYKLLSDTLFLTVNCIDLYLTAHKITRKNLQLLGVASMLVASKYEEISPPRVEDFCYITDNTYMKEEVVNMEKDVLKFLDFQMGSPTTKTFLRIFTTAAQDKPVFSNVRFDYFCCCLAELSLVDYDCVRHLPSKIAASVVFLARLTIDPYFHPWTLDLQQHTGYKPYELKDCVLRLQNLLLRSETSAKAVRQKYMDHKFKCVASLSPPGEIPAFLFEEGFRTRAIPDFVGTRMEDID